jgi:hypothetical protein
MIIVYDKPLRPNLDRFSARTISLFSVQVTATGNMNRTENTAWLELDSSR